MRPFRRLDGGAVEVRLREHEASVLAGLPEQLEELVRRPDTRVHERLFPRAYLDPTEEAAEREWQRLMHEDLLAGKVAAFAEFRRTLQAAESSGRRDVVSAELDEEASAAWLGALNDARLALGVLLEVTEDLDLRTISPDDPRASSYHLYGWLTWLQGELIETLMGGSP